MFCKQCGNELVDGASFCIKCGWKVEIPKEAQPVNKKTIVLVVGPCTYCDESGMEEYLYDIFALYKMDNDSVFGYKLMYAETE